jgi:hypothetical protein
MIDRRSTGNEEPIFMGLPLFFEVTEVAETFEILRNWQR